MKPLAHQIDDCALLIKECLRASGELSELANRLPVTIDHLNLGRFSEFPFLARDGELIKELQRISDRAHRIRELLNMMELGSFSIETKRLAERLWKGLP